ncbi:hypothetical protein RHSIM_Rhsim10G0195500 [Rhododendron simsii]|uniref:DUF4378 domain-containing protein n=1 Tax=Rhododendron simsii TaxID=118357 RepID=A0A834GEU2_RHOSS|nr:hypothetical protein RHSIM_Rhsim10G0195500 [Rhododendron simsii]
MGGLPQQLDFNQGNMARKVITQKRQSGGLEAPRNSLELPVETSQSYFADGDNIPYSYEVRSEWSENSYPTEASMKKLINEEISKRPNNRRNAPSVVARLMGMDMLPLETKTESQDAVKRNEKPRTSLQNKENNKKSSSGNVHQNSNSSKQIKVDQHDEDRNPNHQHVSMKLKKPRPREHPQEEELQKFKKEFEAWQAARFRECTKAIELDRIPSQVLAQETLNMEKIALCGNSSRITRSEKKPVELKSLAVKERSPEGGELPHRAYGRELFPSEQKESHSLRSRTLSRDFDISSAPTKIVILRPGIDRISSMDESWVSSSGTSEERGSIEHFLEEVKQRLKYELQGKVQSRNMIRGGGIETPYTEKPSDPKEIAQRIAKQVRESVTRDLGRNLLRSESTRSYRSEIQNNGPGSPEFINRDTRRLLAERLRNVLKGETSLHNPTVPYSSSSKLSCSDIVEDEPEMQTRSFRRGSDDYSMHHRDLSPMNLVRSLSAPVSGTSFGKLLLEDRHILTGAHIRRKHEAIESVTVDLKKKRKKERFNFKEKVSSFKYSFILRGRLFSRKIQSPEQPRKYECSSLKDITSGPTVVMNLRERHEGSRENSTEVPPSPASVCSSNHEEFWRAADHLSSTSTSDLSPLDDSMPQAFREISSNLTELRRQLNELDSGCPKETIIQEHTLEAEMELEDEAEAYVRDLLVASGLYKGSSEKVLSRWDPFAKLISNRIFEELEESYRNATKKDSEGSKRDNVDHKLLLDLLNEALTIVLGPPVTVSRFRKTGMCPTSRPPHGRKLLHSVWEIICGHLYPPSDKCFYSIDSMLVRDLHSTPWAGLMNDDIDSLGKEMESQITGDLIEEIVKDMHS